MHRRLVLALLVTPALLAGCSASSTSTKSAVATGSAAVPQAGPALVAAALPAVQRSVVRSASITVTVRDASAAADRSTAMAISLGGLVQQDTRSRDGRGSANLVLRIPPRRLGEALSAVAGLGKETGREVQARDVTDQSVDLNSRLATLRTSVARVRVLLARATSVTEITTIERELTRREADLESLQNRATALGDQIDLGALKVTLHGTGTPVAGAGSAGFTDGLRGGWQALATIARAAAVMLGALLPFSPLVLLALVGILRRRRRRTTAASP